MRNDMHSDCQSDGFMATRYLTERNRFVNRRRNRWRPLLQHLKLGDPGVAEKWTGLIESLLKRGLSEKLIVRWGLDDPRLTEDEREILIHEYYTNRSNEGRFTKSSAVSKTTSS